MCSDAPSNEWVSAGDLQLTADGKQPQRTGTSAGIMPTYNDLENTRSVQVCGPPGRTGRWSAVPSPQPALLGAMTECNPKEVYLSNPAIRSARFTAPSS